MKGSSQLGALAVSFLTISLLAFGGANAVIPEMHRQAVEVAHYGRVSVEVEAAFYVQDGGDFS